MRRHATLLDSELGLEPGPELKELQTAMLRQAPELAAWPRSPEWTGAADVAVPTREAAVQPVAVPATSPRAGLVGRSRELHYLTQILGDVSAGSMRWLVLTGPPGIGKTRLAEEAAARAGAAGGEVLWVSCPDEQGTPAWWPMRQLVRALGADADEALEVPPDADPDTARFQVYERIQTLLEQVSRRHPVVVVIDDAQWADPTSASCLAYIAGALRDHPVGVIVTVRDGEHGPEVARLLATAARGDGSRHIAVPALNPRDVATLANQVAHEPDDEFTDAEAALLADRTGGNPFFVAEYARLPRAQRAGAEMPVAVRSVLDRRLASLDPVVLQVLRAAAVIGDIVDIPVLAATTRLDFDTLADDLDEAADERIVVTDHGGDGCMCAHGLLREQLVAGMPALRRQRLHAKVADVLADAAIAPLVDDAPTRRAQHLVAALPLVDPAVVVDACRSAAEQAMQQWSSETAARWWQAALDAYDLMPPSGRVEADRDTLTVSMLEALSRAGRGQTVLDTVGEHLVEALRSGRAATAGRAASALLRASGSWPWLAPGEEPGELLSLLQRVAAQATGEPAAEARIRAAIAVGQCYHPDPAVARDNLDRAMELAQQSGDPEIVADALMGHLITYSGVATYSRQTLDWVARLMELGHSRIREDTVIAHSVATMAAMNLTDVDGAVAHLRAGIEGSEELRLPVLRAQLRWTEAQLAVWRGDFAEAERHHAIAAHVHEQTELYGAGSGLLAAVSLAREKGKRPAEGPLVGALALTGAEGMVDLVQMALHTIEAAPGERAAAEEFLRNGVGRVSAHAWTSLGHSTLLAHLCAEHQLTEFAPALLGELEAFGDRIALIGQVGVVGPVALATARLHALLGEHDRALADLEIAREIAQRTAGAPSVARCRDLAGELDGSRPVV